MKEHSFTKKVPYLGLLTAFALVLSYVESLIPFYFGVPGMKLGLANLAILLCLYLFGPKEAILVNILRVLLAGFMFGNLYSILYSLAGAIISFVVMLIAMKSSLFGIMGVSIAGGTTHNLGQLLVALFVVKTFQVSYYAPALIIAGCITGALIGITSTKILPYIKPILDKQSKL